MKCGLLVAFLLILLLQESTGFIGIRIGIRFRVRFGKRALLSTKGNGSCPYLACKFSTYDGNKDGYITPYEFEDYLQSNSFEDDSLSVYKGLDRDRNGLVNQTEFESEAPQISEGNPMVFPDCDN